MIKHVAFAQQIPILGTSKREDQFSWPEWNIRLTHRGVELHRPATQNVEELPAFEVVGVGCCIRDDTPPSWHPLAMQAAQAAAEGALRGEAIAEAYLRGTHDTKQSLDTRDDSSADVAEPAGVEASGSDAGGTTTGEEPSQVRKTRTRRKVIP